MALLPAFLLAYSLQLAIVVAAIFMVMRILAPRSATLRLRVWQAALVLAVALPVTAWIPIVPFPAGDTGTILSMASVSIEPPHTLEARTLSSSWLLVALLTGTALRAAWIGVGWFTLRRRFAAARTQDDFRFTDACSAVGVHARLLWRTDVSHPFMYGITPPVVVAPADLATASDATLRAIFVHELLHVRRRDWRSVIVEETIRAILWFHPAIWLLLGELRQAREEVIDRASVRLLGSRRSYLETLVVLADRRESLQPSPALPFFRSRQLARRIAALASEASMTTLRVVATCAALFTASLVTLGAAARTFPLPPISLDAFDAIGQSPQPGTPGPIEQTAIGESLEAPLPRRAVYVAPVLPDFAARMGTPEFEVRLVVDTRGRVAEARMLSIKADTIEKDQTGQVIDAVLNAVRQWQFEAPARSPMAFTVNLALEPLANGGKAGSIERPAPIDMKKAAYPQSAQAKKIQGEVALEVTIDGHGKVSDVRVVQALAPELDAAAADAMRASTFRPGMKDGTPVPVKVTITVQFRLK
jgi:TonB family protein